MVENPRVYYKYFIILHLFSLKSNMFNAFVVFSRLHSIVKSALFPLHPYQLLGQILAALSLLAIIKHISLVGFFSAFSMIIDVYNNFIAFTVGCFDPLIKYIISFLREYFSWQISFKEGWRHVFIVLQMLFVRDAGVAFSDGRRSLAVVRLLLGTAISILCSISIFVSYTPNAVISSIIFCGIPVVGLFVYDLTMYAVSSLFFFDEIGIGENDSTVSRSLFFFRGAEKSLYRLLIVYIPSILVFMLPSVRSLLFPRGGVVGILIGLFVNALYWLAHGSFYAFAQRSRGIKFGDAFYASEAGRFGLAVIGVLFWLLMFLAINAGGRLLGL